MTPQHSGDLLSELAEMERDEQEECIHCGKRWYKICHKDGVCYKCQADGKPGRVEFNRRQLRTGWFAYILGLMVVIWLISHFFSQGMEWYVTSPGFARIAVLAGWLFGAFLGPLYGADLGFLLRGVLYGLFYGLLFGAFLGAFSFVSAGLSFFIPFEIVYFALFFLVYLLQKAKKSR